MGLSLRSASSVLNDLLLLDDDLLFFGMILMISANTILQMIFLLPIFMIFSEIPLLLSSSAYTTLFKPFLPFKRWSFATDLYFLSSYFRNPIPPLGHQVESCLARLCFHTLARSVEPRRPTPRKGGRGFIFFVRVFVKESLTLMNAMTYNLSRPIPSWQAKEPSKGSKISANG